MLPKTIAKVLFLGAIMLVMGLGVIACDDGGGGSGNGLDDGLGENGEVQCPPYPTAPHQWNLDQVVPPTTFEGFDEDLNLENLWCQKAIKSVAFVLGAPG